MKKCLYIFDNLAEVERNIKSKEKILLGMDHDGSIAEIITTMQEARMTEQMREVLMILSKNPRICLAFVSGRMIDELKSVVKIDNAFYAGNHGFQIEGYGAEYTYKDKKVIELIEKITKEVEKNYQNIDGIVIERKIYTTSFHFRNVPQNKQESVRTEILNTLNKHKNIRIVEGKKLFNIRPKIKRNKGVAIETIGNHFYKNNWRKHFTVIYIGDDNSDEDAFKILGDNDTGVVVNENPPENTYANYYAKNVKEIEELFRWVNKILYFHCLSGI